MVSSPYRIASTLALAAFTGIAHAGIINLNEVCLSSLSKFLYGHLGVCGAPPNLIIDKSDDYAPWTTKPQCLQAEGQNDKNRYCVFSNKNFADGRGIVLITTEAVAKDTASRAAMADPETIAGLNDLVNPPWGPPAYEKKYIPTRGYGMIANRTIFRGERIMQESPTFVYNRNLYTLFKDEDRIPLQWHAAHTLPPNTRDELLALHKQHGGDEIDDLMRTNAFGAYYGDPYVLHNDVLPRTSRFNHDCRPNAHYFFDLDTMTQYTHAVRTINVGEEILINYTDAEYSYAERQHAIELSWGFSCQCSICRQPPTQIAASDQRLIQISRLKEELNDWTEVQADRAEKALSLIELYRQERLDVPIANAYESAAYAYAMQGDEVKAARYAGMAVEAMTILYGADHPLTMDMEVMMLDPKEHRTWLYKVPGQVEGGGARERKNGSAEATAAAAAEKEGKAGGEEAGKDKKNWSFFS